LEGTVKKCLLDPELPKCGKNVLSTWERATACFVGSLFIYMHDLYGDNGAEAFDARREFNCHKQGFLKFTQV
jgi:hypothetical protein